MKTYVELVAEIDSLSKEAEKVRKEELQTAISQIKSLIKTFGLTAEQLGFTPGNSRGRAKAVAKKRSAKTSRKGSRSVKKPVAVKFKDAAGNTWTGRGKMPVWLVKATQDNKSKLEDFKVSDGV